MFLKIDTDKGTFSGSEIECATFLVKHQPVTVMVVVRHKGDEAVQLVQKVGDWTDGAALRASLFDAHNIARSIL